MLLLSREDIKSVVTMKDMIEADKTAFKMTVDGTVKTPLRTVIDGKYDGAFLFMPAYAPELDAAAMKVIDIFPHNVDNGKMTSPAQVMLIDGKDGYVIALLDGTYVTQLRTGASSGAAFDLLAKKECKKGAMIGTGGQAATQLEAMLAARKLDEVKIYDLNAERCQAFAEQMQKELADYGAKIIAAENSDACIEDADLIITVTPSAKPVFDGAKVKAGATISCVGTYEPHKHEMDPAILPRASKIICDSKEAALSETGDLLIPIKDGIISEKDILGSLGDVINGTIKGRENDDEIIVHTYDLPEEVLENIEITTEDVRYIDCHSYQVSTEINEYLTYFTNVLEASEKKSVAETMDAYNKVYEQMAEKLLRSVGNDRTLRGTEAAISLIVNRVAQKYFINIPGSFSFLIAKLLVVYKENSLQISKWEDEYANALIKTIQKMRRIYVSETMVSDEFSQLLMMNLEEEIPEILKIIMNLTISSYNADFNKNKTFGIVICHGYSTASSIASAVNTMIGSYVFDSIDMPVMTTVEEIKMKLRDKLSRINQHADICIMVDMGSLEKIADDEFAKNRNLAVINSVTTKMALDIGYKIKNAIPIEKFFDNAEEDYKVEYKILKSRKKDAILFTSESGIQTAQRMSNLFYDSLPIEIPVSLQIISFTEAKQEVQKIQEIYNVLFVSGTEDPGVNGIPFIPLQDIITTTNLDLVSTKLSGYLNEDNLKQLIINVRRNFTLMNIFVFRT